MANIMAYIPNVLCQGSVGLQHGPARGSGLPDQVRFGHRYLQEPPIGPRARETAQSGGAKLDPSVT